MKEISVEFLKDRREKSLLVLLIGSSVGVLLGLSLYLANKNVFVHEHSQWLALWDEINLFSSQIFVPLFLALVISRNIQKEYKYHNINVWLTLSKSTSRIVLSKFVYFSILYFVNQLILLLIFYILGLVNHFPININIFIFSFWMFSSWVGGLGIISWEIFLSFKLKNSLNVMLVCLACCILGFIISTINPIMSQLYPFSQILIGTQAKYNQNFNFISGTFFLFICLINIFLGICLSKKHVKI